MAECTQPQRTIASALNFRVLAAQKKGDTVDRVAFVFANFVWESDQCKIFQSQQTQIAAQSPGPAEFSDSEVTGVVKNIFLSLLDDGADNLPNEVADGSSAPEFVNLLAGFENLFVSSIKEPDFSLSG